MGVPTSEVGYTSAMPRRKDNEVHKDMWGIGKKKKKHLQLRPTKTYHRQTGVYNSTSIYFIFIMNLVNLKAK